MKQLFITFFIILVFFGCSTPNLRQIPNTFLRSRTKISGQEETMTATIGSVILQKRVDNCLFYECFTNLEPVNLPKKLLKQINIKKDVVVLPGQQLCSIYKYDCSSDIFYFLVEITNKDSQEEASFVKSCELDMAVTKIENKKGGSAWNIYLIGQRKYNDKSEVFFIAEKIFFKFWGKIYEFAIPSVTLRRLVTEEFRENIYLEELVWGGVQGNELIFYYREYHQNQPMLTQFMTLYYNLESVKRDKKIRFRNYDIEIINFDNQSITYKIKQN